MSETAPAQFASGISFGEVERAGPSTRNMERFPLRDSAVFLTPLADRNTWQDLQTTLSHQL
jgi:hypothetical protein